MKCNALRFRHHHLPNGAVLTVCTNLRHEERQVDVGWSVFNPTDDRWIRKVGCEIAKNRLFSNQLYFSLSPQEPILCDYISFRALALILAVSNANPSEFDLPEDQPLIIPKQTMQSIQFEMIEILNLLGQRVGLPNLYD
jgi:hypothetical protein